jgi:hypothetical protein
MKVLCKMDLLSKTHRLLKKHPLCKMDLLSKMYRLSGTYRVSRFPTARPIPRLTACRMLGRSRPRTPPRISPKTLLGISRRIRRAVLVGTLGTR